MIIFILKTKISIHFTQRLIKYKNEMYFPFQKKKKTSERKKTEEEIFKNICKTILHDVQKKKKQITDGEWLP